MKVQLGQPVYVAKDENSDSRQCCWDYNHPHQHRPALLCGAPKKQCQPNVFNPGWCGENLVTGEHTIAAKCPECGAKVLQFEFEVEAPDDHTP